MAGEISTSQGFTVGYATTRWQELEAICASSQIDLLRFARIDLTAARQSTILGLGFRTQ